MCVYRVWFCSISLCFGSFFFLSYCRSGTLGYAYHFLFIAGIWIVDGGSTLDGRRGQSDKTSEGDLGMDRFDQSLGLLVTCLLYIW